jgi:antitoxin component YwqK of YwqJK toxin-antitoxin module
MRKLILLSTILIGTFSFSQNMPEINVKSTKEKGKAKIYYYLRSDFVYFPNTKLIDWSNSLEKLEVSEKFNPKKKYFVETCKFLEGKKNGEFAISQLLLKETRTSYGSIFYTSQGGDIITGNYLNGNYIGKINFLTFIDLDSKEGFLRLDYEEGKIKDQLLKYPEVVKSSQRSFTPFVRFESGLVKESLYKDNEVITYKIFEGKSCSIMRYGNGNEISKIKFEGSAMGGLQCYTTVLENNSKNFVLSGSYRVYQLYNNYNLFDTTTKLLVSLNFKNGIQEGIQLVKSLNFNLSKEFRCINGLIEGQLKGFINDKINFTEEYLNGKLNGISKTYFDDGKIAVEANYVDGHLSGITNSYFNSSSKYNCFIFEKQMNFTDLEVSLSDNEQNVYMLSKVNENLRDAFYNKIISEGGKVDPLDIDGYFLCESMSYKYDTHEKNSLCNLNIVNYLYSSGKIMASIILGAKTDAIWFDSNGKKIGSLSGVLKEEQKVKEAINNVMVSCSFCSKKAKYGDGVITYGDCNCFDYKNGKKEKVHVGSLFERETYFCSRKCVSEFEKDCCRRNGHSSE